MATKDMVKEAFEDFGQIKSVEVRHITLYFRESVTNHVKFACHSHSIICNFPAFSSWFKLAGVHTW